MKQKVVIVPTGPSWKLQVKEEEEEEERTILESDSIRFNSNPLED